MKVWIVTHWWAHEGEVIEGVYASEAAARAAHPKAKTEQEDSATSFQYDGLSLEEWEVEA